MKKENKITIKSIINKTLIGIFLSAPIIIVILMIIADSRQDNLYYAISIAIYPILGIVASPNIILHAIKNNKEEDEEFYSKKNILRSKFSTLDICISNRLTIKK